MPRTPADLLAPQQDSLLLGLLLTLLAGSLALHTSVEVTQLAIPQLILCSSCQLCQKAQRGGA